MLPGNGRGREREAEREVGGWRRAGTGGREWRGEGSGEGGREMEEGRNGEKKKVERKVEGWSRAGTEGREQKGGKGYG